MDKQKKRALFLITILLLLSLYFLWGIFNDGKIEVSSPPPFAVEVFGEGETDCKTSPCIIKAEPGTKDLILKKQDHFSILEEVEVQAFRTTSLNVNFQKVPKVKEISDFPITDSQISYTLKNGQNLTKPGTPQPVAFFPIKIKTPQIYGNTNTVIINGDKDYKVDLTLDKKSSLPLLPRFTSAQLSPTSQHLIFTYKSTDTLWLLNPDDSLKKTSLLSKHTKTSWTAENQILFLTAQDFDEENKQYVTTLNNQGLNLGKYDPKKDLYFKITHFKEITSLPENLLAAPNGNSLYYQIGDKKFAINLK